MDRQTLHHLFAYDDAVLRALLEHLRAQTARPDPASPSAELPDRVRPLFAHILAARAIWLARLTGAPAETPVWPDWSWEECETTLAAVARSYGRYLAAESSDDLRGEITYRNSQGTEFRNRPGDILHHVLLHGATHRGQIALLLRQAGLEPLNTDYISYLRSG